VVAVKDGGGRSWKVAVVEPGRLSTTERSNARDSTGGVGRGARFRDLRRRRRWQDGQAVEADAVPGLGTDRGLHELHHLVPLPHEPGHGKGTKKRKGKTNKIK
jgi:hypothetical protein